MCARHINLGKIREKELGSEKIIWGWPYNGLNEPHLRSGDDGMDDILFRLLPKKVKENYL